MKEGIGIGIGIGLVGWLVVDEFAFAKAYVLHLLIVL